jgi:hypothetical protein
MEQVTKTMISKTEGRPILWKISGTLRGTLTPLAFHVSGWNAKWNALGTLLLEVLDTPQENVERCLERTPKGEHFSSPFRGVERFSFSYYGTVQK